MSEDIGSVLFLDSIIEFFLGLEEVISDGI